ncbi:MAG: DUF1592 domain-containing protein [Myxococcota bacterium]
MKRIRWGALSVLGIWSGVTGCYTGLDHFDGVGEDSGLPSGDDGDEPGEPVPESEPLCDGEPSLAPVLTWRLTESQYDNTMRDLLGIEDASGGTLAVGDGRIGVFSNNTDAEASLPIIEQYGLLAREVAEATVTDLAGRVPCDPAAGNETCAAAFIDQFGLRAQRRPLSEAAREDFLALYRAGAQESFEAGIRMVIEAMLQSPHFLYRVEQGTPRPGTPDVLVLDDYELASRLSYFLLDSMPDDALLSAAAAGELSTQEGLRTQAERLLAKPEAIDALARFHFQWLGIDEVEGKPKDVEVWDDDLAIQSMDEIRRLLTRTIIEGDARLSTLLTTRESEASADLAELVYGVGPEQRPAGDVPFELPPEHAGILLRSGFLAAHSHAERQSPVLSGYVLRTHLLCQPMPPPTPGVDTTPPVPDPSTSTREQYMLMLDDPNCKGCHQLMNPLGFSLLNYDAVGRYQTMEGPHVIDPSGELLGTDVDGEFEDAVELMDRLAHSENVADCVATQWFDFAVGHPPREADACSLEHVREQFRGSGYDLRTLILEIVQTDAFRYRMAGQE